MSRVVGGQPLQIGRIVHYRSRTGSYTVPAIVNCTQDSIYQPGVDAGHVPPLTQEHAVHLTVFTPGQPGMRMGGTDFIAEPQHRVSENVAGCYQEWDIPFDPAGAPGTWSWPGRA